MNALIISNTLLWMVVVGLALIGLAILRQIGVLYERVAPIGALTMDHGPKVGDVSPVFELDSLGGGMSLIGKPTGRSQMLFFLSPSCPVCKKLLPVLRSLNHAERGSLAVILASDGEIDAHRAFYLREKLAPFPYVLSTDLGMKFRISKLPYAVLINSEGRISAKGLVNSREQIESLLEAHDRGVGSLQEYLTRNKAARENEHENAAMSAE